MLILRPKKNGASYLLTCIIIGSSLSITLLSAHPRIVVMLYVLMVSLDLDLLDVMHKAQLCCVFFYSMVLCYNIASGEAPPPVGQASGGRPGAFRSLRIRL
jgi:hypothetical protein